MWPSLVDLKLRVLASPSGAAVAAHVRPSLALNWRVIGSQFWPKAYLCLCGATQAELESVKEARDEFEYQLRVESAYRHEKTYAEPMRKLREREAAKRKRDAEKRAAKRQRGELICVKCKKAPVMDGLNSHDFCTMCANLEDSRY